MDSKQPTLVLDPSTSFRPENPDHRFRNFELDNSLYNRVRSTYDQMHTIQSYQYAQQRMEYWGQFNHDEMPVLDAVEALDDLVDEADPDVDLPNSVHAYQTAERIREKYPSEGWLQLTGLIHDAGKIMALWGEPQHSVVGDTFVTGCAYPESIVFGRKSFSKNADYDHPVYSTKLGTYKEHCGLMNVTMNWGHDEYLYRVLEHNGHSLPEEAMYIIRFHSFYPWHTSEDYMYLCNDKDMQMLPWIREFNKFDLYSKTDSVPDRDELRSYYQELCDKYLPKTIKW